MKVYEKETIEKLRNKSVSSSIGIPTLKRDYSPFRYPGGKGKLSRFLAYFIIHNDLVGSRVIEPFCGGAGGTLPLLEAGLISHLVLNDLNPAVYSFWNLVKSNPEELISLVLNEPLNIERWKHWNAVYNDKSASMLELGFSAFYMNRTNRSGILHAGPIGGKNQTGEYKLDCRFNRIDLAKRIERLSLLSDRIDVSSIDAADVIMSIAKKDDFIYADPPYVKEGKTIYRGYSYDEKDHYSFSQVIKRASAKWLMSYDDHPLIHALYSKSGINVVEFSYVMNRAKIGRELLIASSKLTLPVVPDKAKEKNRSYDLEVNEKVI